MLDNLFFSLFHIDGLMLFTVGTIEKIEKKKAFINYGMFTTETNVDKLELVEKAQ